MPAGLQDTEDLSEGLRWRTEPYNAFLKSKSVAYLQRSGQLRDLDFILSHFDDIDTPGKVSADEVTAFAVASEV
jgi:hypothetical protein